MTTKSPGRDPWGDPIKTTTAENKPAAPTHRFGPVQKIEGGRDHDAWGDPLPERGMAVAEFNQTVQAAQEQIFTRVRPGYGSDQEAIRYVAALTSNVREWCHSDANFVSELHKMADRTPVTRNLAARTEVRRTPSGAVDRPSLGSKTSYVREEGTTR